MKINTGVQVIFRLCLRNFKGCNISIVDGGIVMYTVEMPSCGMIFLPTFRKSGAGVYVIHVLRFCLSNLNGYNVGITEGKEL
jgi:hypothetical protein